MRNNVIRTRTWIVAFLLGLLIWGSGQAFAGYDARPSELRDRLAKESLAGQKERDVLSKALDDYVRAREQCLEDLVRIVEESDAGKDEQEAAWEGRLATCKQDPSRLADAVRSLSGVPSTGAYTFANVTALQEEKFFEGLAQTRIGERRDHLIVNQKNVEEMRDDLQEEWDEIADQEKSIHESEESVVSQLEDMIDRWTDQAARERRTIKEKLNAGAPIIVKVMKLTSMPLVAALQHFTGHNLSDLQQGIQLVEDSGPAIDAFSGIYRKANEAYLARKIEYDALVRSERGGIYVLYSNFRQQTQDFVEKNGFDKAKVDYQEASDAMASWVSGTETSGQRSDADAFSRDVMAKLSDHLAKTETVFNEFVSKNKGKFFGPIGPDIEEALTATRMWEQWDLTIQSKGLDAKLRSWRDEANIFWAVDISGLTSEDQGYVRGLIKERVEKLVESLDQAVTIPQQFHHDFDRSVLEDDHWK